MKRFWWISVPLGVWAGAIAWAGDSVEPVSFEHAGVVSSWMAYADKLTFGRGQTLALVDAGYKLSMPEWSTPFDGQPKVLVTYDNCPGH
ncbi:MAG: hypothetical protein U0929_15485 [Planctomycetaceae bacterium]